MSGGAKAASNGSAEIGPAPGTRQTVDRIDPRGHYEPGNVRWATPKAQQRNRSNNRTITYRGETRLLVEWAEAIGVRPDTLRMRIDHYGWPLERALTAPTGPQRKRS